MEDTVQLHYDDELKITGFIVIHVEKEEKTDPNLHFIIEHGDNKRISSKRVKSSKRMRGAQECWKSLYMIPTPRVKRDKMIVSEIDWWDSNKVIESKDLGSITNIEFNKTFGFEWKDEKVHAVTMYYFGKHEKEIRKKSGKGKITTKKRVQM